jgi:hypothetical protein
MISATDPYSANPTIPRKVTPTGVVLDPTGTNPTPTSQPPQTDTTNATTIQQLSDGAGGAVTVPPPSLSPLTPNMTPNINVIPGVTPTVAAPTPPAPGTFNAGTNLINAQVDPAASARLLSAQGLQDQTLQQAVNGPDRFKLAEGAYGDFAKLAQANLGRATQDLTGAAASHGQIGSGMLTNKYGDLNERYQLNDQLARSGFLRDALQGTIGDRLNNASLAQGAASNIYGQEAAARGETRGERDYQQQLAEQAIQRRIQQQALEQQQQGQNFAQGVTLYGLGAQADPTSAYQNAAGLSSGEATAAAGDVGALLRAYLARTGGGY